MQVARYAIAATFTAVMTFGFSAAAAAEWKLVEVKGVVRVAAPGREPAAAVANQVLPTGSTVTTAAGGRAALFNGDQRVTLGPNSRMTVAPESSAGVTRIMQDLGSILFQVDKRPSQHFRVETPLLAAIVKGTTFTVNVDLTASSVHVAEGLVEVRAGQGGAVQDVGAGATARIARDAPTQLQVATPSTAVDEVSAAPAPPLDYAAVSGGLVTGPAEGAGSAGFAASGDQAGGGPRAGGAEAAGVAAPADNATGGAPAAFSVAGQAASPSAGDEAARIRMADAGRGPGNAGGNGG
ncbi:MAG: FecR family protein, partial [Pseudomonadota bacterium]